MSFDDGVCPRGITLRLMILGILQIVFAIALCVTGGMLLSVHSDPRKRRHDGNYYNFWAAFILILAGIAAILPSRFNPAKISVLVCMVGGFLAFFVSLVALVFAADWMDTVRVLLDRECRCMGMLGISTLTGEMLFATCAIYKKLVVPLAVDIGVTLLMIFVSFGVAILSILQYTRNNCCIRRREQQTNPPMLEANI